MPSVNNNYESLTKEELVRLLVERDLDVEGNPYKKKYGLIWEDKPEQFEAESVARIPVLKRDSSKSLQQDSAKPTHVLIQGDNFHALKVLAYTHERAVDVIYIDPPYNTGNKDFRYNDKFVDREDGYRHSKWLSFMAKRLRLAKTLLSDTGVLVVSIDDNEYAQLKLLLDETFGEDNFISSMVWNGGKKNNSRFVSNGHEYMLVYAKNLGRLIQQDVRWRVKKTGVDEACTAANEIWERNHGDVTAATKEWQQWLKKADLKDGVARYKWLDEHVTTLGPVRIDRDISSPSGAGYRYELRHPATGRPCSMPATGWRYSEQSMAQLVSYGRIHFGPDETRIPSVKAYLSDSTDQVLESVISKERQAAAKALAEMVPSGFFQYPKDREILEMVIGAAVPSDGVVLDFFAGSGTTAHAVMSLNAADGGTRQCILVTNDEGEFKLADGTVLEGGICTNVTLPRVRKAIEGYIAPSGRSVPGLAQNLAFYSTEFVEDRPIERHRKELSARSAEMLCLRESCFLEEKTGDKRWRSFVDGQGKRLVVVTDAYVADELRPLLEADKRPTVLYAFRFDEDDEPAREYGGKGLEHVTAKPIPDSILTLHRRLAKQE